jgi:hypothetical protein
MTKKTPRQTLASIIKKFELIEKELQAQIKKATKKDLKSLSNKVKKAAKKDLKSLRAKIKKLKSVKKSATAFCKTKTFN